MKNNTITTIGRAKNWYRPYFVNGKEIENIVIYKDGEIIIHIRRSWFEEVYENFETKYHGDLLEVSFDGPVKRANKLNLNRKDNFIYKQETATSTHGGRVLYIHADNIFKNYIEMPKMREYKNKDFYLYGYKVNFKYEFKQDEMYLKYYKKGEKLEPEDRRKDLHNAVLKDENGNVLRDENGKIMKNENLFYCSRTREITTKKEIIIHNGLYIKEGK